MEYVARRSEGGPFENIYKLIMRRNSIYVVDYGVHKLWERNHVGKRYEGKGNQSK